MGEIRARRGVAEPPGLLWRALRAEGLSTDAIVEWAALRRQLSTERIILLVQAGFTPSNALEPRTVALADTALRLLVALPSGDED